MSEHEKRTISRQICMDDEVYYDMKEGLIFRLMEIKGVDHLPWITAEEAMNLIRISSQTTLKKFCDQGHIKVSKITSGIVLYNRQSILDFIEKHEVNPKK